MNSVQKNILWVVSIVAIALGLWYFRDIVFYILIAAVLNIVLSPLANLIGKIKIRQKYIPRWIAAMVSLILGGGIMLGVLFSLIPLVFSKLNELSSIDVTSLAASIDEPLRNLQNLIVEKFQLAPDFSLTAALLTSLKDALNLGTINQVFSGAVSIVGNTAIGIFAVVFITFFFLKEETLFRDIVLTISPRKYEENIKRALESITHLLKRYFTGILVESTIIFTVISVILLLFGMSASNALFIGTMLGILNVVPYIGPMIGCCIGIIMGILSPIDAFSTLEMVAVVGGTVAIARMLDNFVLQPFLYSNSVHAHPLEIFLVILIAGNVGGVLGMLFAIPMYNVVRVFAKEFFNNIRVVQKLTEKM
ncbi:MAG: AI-2E family transporter [Rikenellaceae bacterium]|nr:AI-2E family transporter [Rikenellaceae bacterium]